MMAMGTTERRYTIIPAAPYVLAALARNAPGDPIAEIGQSIIRASFDSGASVVVVVDVDRWHEMGDPVEDLATAMVPHLVYRPFQPVTSTWPPE